ncbi:protein YAE1 homolog isoform X2 [Venturia canescens]|nr:protein YAE1 homolog isoform X2 [Venturia canescens]XP_043271491.1 protein YAE1 homolog isoform X2 [Venturia canescens]
MCMKMDDHSDSEDSLMIAQKSWTRVIDAASKTGYRDGIEEGSQAVLQKDFDQGYEDGFKAAFELGKYKGLSSIYFKDHAHPDEIVGILEKTRRGACHICISESKERASGDENSSTTKIIEDHRKHVESRLKVLREYFEPLMKEKRINVVSLEN